ncbi:unnamed protein product, partial [Brenthis ino]
MRRKLVAYVEAIIIPCCGMITVSRGSISFRGGKATPGEPARRTPVAPQHASTRHIFIKGSRTKKPPQWTRSRRKCKR